MEVGLWRDPYSITRIGLLVRKEAGISNTPVWEMLE